MEDMEQKLETQETVEEVSEVEAVEAVDTVEENVASEEIDIMRLDGVVLSTIIVGSAAALHDLDLQFRVKMLDEGTVVLG